MAKYICTGIIYAGTDHGLYQPIFWDTTRMLQNALVGVPYSPQKTKLEDSLVCTIWNPWLESGFFRYDDFTQFQVSQNKGNSIKSFVRVNHSHGLF